jgi:hypothetical protein
MTQLFFSEYEAPEAAPPLVIFGAGGLGREVLLLLHQLNATHPTWDVRGFYDDQAPATPTVAGLPYLGSSADLNATTEPLAVAVAVGSPVGRAAVVARLTSAQLSFPTLIHPLVALGPDQRITLGEGSIVQQGCLLTCDITLGRFVLLNSVPMPPLFKACTSATTQSWALVRWPYATYLPTSRQWAYPQRH